MYGKSLMHLVFWSGLGIGLWMIATPSQSEVDKIKDFTDKNSGFSKVLRAASDPNSKPIHLRKPGEQFVAKSTTTSQEK